LASERHEKDYVLHAGASLSRTVIGSNR